MIVKCNFPKLLYTPCYAHTVTHQFFELKKQFQNWNSFNSLFQILKKCNTTLEKNVERETGLVYERDTWMNLVLNKPYLLYLIFFFLDLKNKSSFYYLYYYLRGSLFEILFFFFFNVLTPLYFSRDKTKGQSNENTIITPIKTLPKK